MYPEAGKETICVLKTAEWPSLHTRLPAHTLRASIMKRNLELKCQDLFSS